VSPHLRLLQHVDALLLQVGGAVEHLAVDPHPPQLLVPRVLPPRDGVGRAAAVHQLRLKTASLLQTLKKEGDQAEVEGNQLEMGRVGCRV
jgi:hypothetical protein